MFESILTPMLALIVWTFVMWLWLYVTRIPAMKRAGVSAAKIKEKGDLDVLPLHVRRVADNYNHLHEQPTVFLALVIYCHLAGIADLMMIQLAWSYVMLRALHSLVQALWNFVPVRFAVFASSSVVLMVMAGRAVLSI